VAKTIVYLDHNFVSNLAKARAGWIGDAGLQGYYAHLFEVLEPLVLDNRIVCPRSTLHNIEAEFDERLETQIRLTIAALARDVRFLHSTEVLDNQGLSLPGRKLSPAIRRPRSCAICPSSTSRFQCLPSCWRERGGERRNIQGTQSGAGG